MPFSGDPYYRLEWTEQQPVWRFPEDRFVQWGPEDESYCRLAGFGREETVEFKAIIPRAYVKSLDSGGITFVCVPEQADKPTRDRSIVQPP